VLLVIVNTSVVENVRRAGTGRKSDFGARTMRRMGGSSETAGSAWADSLGPARGWHDSRGCARLRHRASIEGFQFTLADERALG